MAPKRPNEASEDAQDDKRARKGFRVGPDNLPDGPWRRKGESTQVKARKRFFFLYSSLARPDVVIFGNLEAHITYYFSDQD